MNDKRATHLPGVQPTRFGDPVSVYCALNRGYMVVLYLIGDYRRLMEMSRRLEVIAGVL